MVFLDLLHGNFVASTSANNHAAVSTVSGWKGVSQLRLRGQIEECIESKLEKGALAC